MRKVDTNVLLRYLLNDHPEFSPKAREIIDQNVVEVPIEVLCEAVYVLAEQYQADHQTISAQLKYFFNQTRCVLPHRKAVLQGIEYFGSSNFDFVDCLLAGYAEIEKDEIFTFDKRLKKLVSKEKKP